MRSTTRNRTTTLLLLASLTPFARPAAAQTGTAPPILCGKSYVLAIAGRLHAVADEASSLDLQTAHYLSITEIGPGACPGAPYEVSLTATLDCDQGSSGDPLELGPFAIDVGLSQIPIEIPIPSGPPRDCTLTLESQVDFGDGSIIAQTATAPIAVRSDLAVEVFVEGPILTGHPGEAMSRDIVVTNNTDETVTVTLRAVSDNVADVPEVLAGEDSVRRGVFSIADPVGDAFVVSLSPVGAGGDACPPAERPGYVHETTEAELILVARSASSHNVRLKVLTDEQALLGSGSGVTLSITGTSGFFQTVMVLGAIFSDLHPPDDAACTRQPLETTTMTEPPEVIGGGLVVENNVVVGFVADADDITVDVDGEPPNGEDFLSAWSLTDRVVRGAFDSSFWDPPRPSNSVVNIDMRMQITSETLEPTIEAAEPIPDAPSGFDEFNPTADVVLSLPPPEGGAAGDGPVLPVEINTLHQLSAIGVTESFQFIPMRFLSTDVSAPTPTTLAFDVQLQADEPPDEPLIGVTLLHDLRGVARYPGAACPADTDGTGAIDVDDLLNVILDWGTDGSGHGGDVNGSGIADVDDLTAVILSWGPCP